MDNELTEDEAVIQTLALQKMQLEVDNLRLQYRLAQLEKQLADGRG